MTNDRKNTYWLTGQYAYLLITGLLTLKLNISHFGKELFGSWLLLFSLWNFGTALDFGFSTAVVKYIAQYSKDGKGRLNEVVSTTFFVFVGIGIAVFFVINIFFRPIYLNQVPEAQLSVFKNVFWLLGCIFLLRYFSIYFRSLFEGFSNFTFSSKINIIQSTLTLISVIIVSYYDLSLIDLALFYLIIPIVILCILLISVRKHYPHINFSLSNFNPRMLKEIFTFSFSVQLTNIFSAMVDPLVKYLINSLVGVSFIPIFEIGRRVTLSISTLFWTTFKTVLPKAAILKTEEERRNFVLDKCVKISLSGITYAGLFFGVLLIFIVGFVHFWFGIDEAIPVLIILALPETINSFGFSIYSFIIGIGKASLLAVIQFVNLSSVGISLYISFYFYGNMLGLLGIYASVILANVLMLLFIKNSFCISIRSYLDLSHFYKLIALNVMLLVLCVVMARTTEYNYMLLSIVSLLSLFIFRKDLRKLLDTLYKDILSLT